MFKQIVTHGSIQDFFRSTLITWWKHRDLIGKSSHKRTPMRGQCIVWICGVQQRFQIKIKSRYIFRDQFLPLLNALWKDLRLNEKLPDAKSSIRIQRKPKIIFGWDLQNYKRLLGHDEARHHKHRRRVQSFHWILLEVFSEEGTGRKWTGDRFQKQFNRALFDVQSYFFSDPTDQGHGNSAQRSSLVMSSSRYALTRASSKTLSLQQPRVSMPRLTGLNSGQKLLNKILGDSLHLPKLINNRITFD